MLRCILGQHRLALCYRAAFLATLLQSQTGALKMTDMKMQDMFQVSE